jgi:iron complex outermembrane recepter protein
VRIIAVASCVTLLLLAGTVRADDVTSTPVTLNIPPQPVRAALKEFSHQAGVQVLVRVDNISVDSVIAPKVIGQLTVGTALDRLLDRSGLKYEVVGDKMIRIAAVTGSAGPAEEGAAQESAQKKSFWERFRLAEADQGTPAPAVEAGESESEKKATQLQEVVVTATRREESVEKVPISLNALSASDLAAGGIKSISDLSAATPGLQFAQPSGFSSTFTTIAIRGMNTNAGSSTVGVYLDDTPLLQRLSPLGNIGGAYPAMFDLNRVEVARGPQGTLFGAGAEAGTVRFISNDPSLTDFSGLSRAELAMTESGRPSYEIGEAVGGPIVQDSVGFRVSAWTRQDGGYINLIDPISGNMVKPNANTDQTSAFRGALAFQVGAIRLTPSLYYQTVHADDSGRFYGNFSSPSQGYFANGPLLPSVSSDNLLLPTLKVDARLPFADLTATSSFLHRNALQYEDISAITGDLLGGYGSPLGIDFPVSPSDVAPTYIGLKQTAFTQEVRLTSKQRDAFLTWVAGLFYDHREQKDYQVSYSTFVDPSGAPVLDDHQQVTDDQIALYGQIDAHLTDKLTLTAGERVAKVKSNLTYTVGTGVFDQGLPPVSGASLRETPSTPRVSISYQATENHLFYISAGEGFRVGGGNPGLPSICNYSDVAHTYDADYARSYEIGAKDALFGGKLQLDSSVFHVDWLKMQQQVFVACGYGFIANVGTVESNGFEFAARAAVTNRLRFKLDVGYADAYFKNDVYNSSGQLIAREGDKIGFLPQVNAPWNIDVSATYEFPLSHGDAVYLRGDYQYQSRNPGPFVTQIPTSPSYYPELVANPPTHLTNARLGYKNDTDKLNVAFFLNNAFNSHPVLGAYQNAANAELLTYNTFRPRTLGLSVDYAF